MSTVSFQTAVVAIAQVFAMGLVGFFLMRRRIMDEGGLKLLTFLSINIVFPMFIFNQIIRNFHPDKIHLWWGYPLINIGLIATGLLLTSLVFKLSRRKPEDAYLTASAFHNAGYIPILMAMALPLADAAGAVYAAVIMSIIGFDLCLWSVGVWMMTRQKTPCMELKNMINPPLLSMWAAVIIVLAGGQGFFSETLLKPVKIMGDAAMCITMLVIGGNLALTNFSKIHGQQILGIVLIKLMLVPLVALTALLFLHLDPIMSFVVMLQSCMPTSITLSIIGRHYGTKNQDFINQTIFVTHVCCVISVPIWLGLYGKLIH